jgi:hypothetical protein
MSWIARTLRLSAAESHINITLAICVVVMSAMSIAIVWQAQIIARQRDVIQWLEALKLGG